MRKHAAKRHTVAKSPADESPRNLECLDQGDSDSVAFPSLTVSQHRGTGSRQPKQQQPHRHSEEPQSADLPFGGSWSSNARQTSG